MPCLALLFALISPRLAIIFVALFSNILTRSMGSWIVPFIGFFILPWTTLAYAVMWDSGTNEVTGFEWFIVAMAFFLDLASYGGGYRRRRG